MGTRQLHEARHGRLSRMAHVAQRLPVDRHHFYSPLFTISAAAPRAAGGLQVAGHATVFCRPIDFTMTPTLVANAAPARRRTAWPGLTVGQVPAAHRPGRS